MQKVRFKRTWRGVEPGTVKDMEGGIAEGLRQRGVLAFVNENETAAVEGAPRTAMKNMGRARRRHA